MPYVLAFALTMILAALTLPRTSGELPGTFFLIAKLICSRRTANIVVLLPLAHLGFLVGLLYLGQRQFPAHHHSTSPANPYQGISYVSWPRLNPPLEILSYSGPGARSQQKGRGVTFSGMLSSFGMKGRSKVGVAAGGARRGEEVEMGRKKGNLID